jgi:hypothetical protein
MNDDANVHEVSRFLINGDLYRSRNITIRVIEPFGGKLCTRMTGASSRVTGS